MGNSWKIALVFPWIYRFSLLSLVPLLVACTSVSIYGDASVTKSHWFAPLKIESQNKAATVIVSITGFGLVPGWQNATFGYKKESLVLIEDPEKCRVVFFVENNVDVRSIEALFQKSSVPIDQLCVLKTERQP